MGRACGMYGEEQKFIQVSAGETLRKHTDWETEAQIG